MASNGDIQWHILGTGAIGGLWACALQAEGRAPQLIFKNAAILRDYQQKSGLTLEGDGKHRRLSVAATCPEQLTAPIDHLLVTTKATQTLAALTAVKPWLTCDTTVVLMQNGLGVADALLAQYPQIRLLLASTTEGAYRPSPFHIVHAGHGKTLLGCFQQSLEQDELEALAHSLSSELVQVQPHDDMEAVLWRKLAVNCAINPLTALYGCCNGELLDNEETRQWMDQICEEFLAVSAALNRQGWVGNLKQLVRQVATDTADNRSSMLQDIRQGRLTEIDAINGYVCQLARQQGIPANSNHLLVERIHAMERELGCG